MAKEPEILTPGKTVIIYNPRAGKLNRRGQGALARAADILRTAGYDAILTATTGPASGGGLARAAVEDGATLVIAAGGDGTINEVLAGLAGTTVPLGILPAGTANVLATEIGLPTTLEAAAARLPGCVPARISLGRVRSPRPDEPPRYFLLMAGVGLDALIVYRVSAPLKARLGKIAYWIAGFGIAGRTLDEFEVVAGGRSYSCSFALISKVRNYGGDFQIACATSLFDDCFEVVLFSGRSSLRYVKYLAGVAFQRLSGMRGVTVLHTSEVTLAPSPDCRTYIQVDGEFAGPLPAVVETVPDALTLLVPPAYAARFSR